MKVTREATEGLRRSDLTSSGQEMLPDVSVRAALSESPSEQQLDHSSSLNSTLCCVSHWENDKALYLHPPEIHPRSQARDVAPD